MIALKNMTTLTLNEFDITTFPDWTVQAWKIDPAPKKGDKFEITFVWDTTSNAGHIGLFAVGQLAVLIHELTGEKPDLIIPFLPYARQDKEIGNESTFALSHFALYLNALPLNKIKSYDVHSMVAKKLIAGLEDISPVTFFNEAIENMIERNEGKGVVVIFPDVGAQNRYKSLTIPDNCFIVTGIKARDVETGIVSGVALLGHTDKISDNICIVIDDICDGGATFIEIAKRVKPLNPKEMFLAVTHGIFSKGEEDLLGAGYTHLFTTNTLIHNLDQYPLVRL